MPLQQSLKEKLPLIIAIACGILAILLLNFYIQRREVEFEQRIKEIKQQAQAVKPPEKTTIVLVAKRAIPPHTPITAFDLSMKEIPVNYVQPGAVNTIEEVIGQISSSKIAEGEQIIKTKLLAPAKIGKTLSEITPKGKRAVTISVDNISSISGLIKPGDYVDVFTLVSPPSGGNWPDTKEKIPRLVPLFQSVTVLAVASDFVGPSESIPEEEEATKKKQERKPDTVTLALDPQEAIMLSFVQDHGKIKLALRSTEDAKKEPIKQADWDTLFEYLYPTRVKSIETEEGEKPVVEIFRGFKREEMPLSETK